MQLLQGSSYFKVCLLFSSDKTLLQFRAKENRLDRLQFGLQKPSSCHRVMDLREPRQHVPLCKESVVIVCSLHPSFSLSLLFSNSILFYFFLFGYFFFLLNWDYSVATQGLLWDIPVPKQGPQMRSVPIASSEQTSPPTGPDFCLPSKGQQTQTNNPRDAQTQSMPMAPSPPSRRCTDSIHASVFQFTLLREQEGSAPKFFRKHFEVTLRS